jgi:hypothetical protein
MRKYVIERTLPGAGRLSAEELQGIAVHSCGVLQEMGTQIQWIQTFVTDDKLYCTYMAEDADLVREHARRGGFPADRVAQVVAIIDPTTPSVGVAI